MDTTMTTGLENVVSSASTSNTKSSSMSSVGKDEFMKLLIAQLKNQDPLKPMDGTEFATQLAEFSSLEQLTNLNTELKAHSLSQMTLGYAQSANMIGKEVEANTGNTVLVDGDSTDLTYRLAEDAQTVTITILDANGNVVKTLKEGVQQAGMNKVVWDSSGADRANHTYQVVATNASGGAVEADTLTTGMVTAVHYRGNEILVTVNGQDIPLSDISSISEADTTITEAESEIDQESTDNGL